MGRIKLDDLAKFNMGQSPLSSTVSDVEGGFPFLQGNAEFGSITPNHRLYCTRPIKLCKSGDVLISVRAPVGALNKADQIYCIGRGLAAISFVEVPPNFGWHLLNYWVKDLRIVAQGSTFEAISKTDLENLWVVCPSDQEQYYIAQILDTLDTQIRETERLIAKLKQVKTGLLHDLLTKGITKRGEVRDPRVHPEQFKEIVLQERIQIPKEWEIRTLDYFLTGINAGKSPNCPDRPAGADEWGILKVSAIHLESFREWENKVITNPAYIIPSHEVQDGDLLISRANTYKLVGMVCLVRKPRPQLLLCDKTLRLHVDHRHASTEFIFYILQMPFVRSQIEIHATGTSGSMKNISQDTIKKLKVYVPPLEEQMQIVAILRTCDARIAAKEVLLGKLHQMKKDLMHDFLTGTVRFSSLVVSDKQ